MSRRALVAVVASVLAWTVVLVSTVQGASGPGSREYVLVTLRPGASDGALRALVQQAGCEDLEVLRPLPVHRLALLPNQDLEEALKTLRGSPLVQTAEVDGEQRNQTVPNDSLYSDFQWNLRNIHAERAWDLRPSAPEMIVAVLDSGVDIDHPDLRPNLLLDGAYDFINNSPIPRDDESHGTAVAGIVGAVGNNGQGVTGVDWRVKILPLKTLDRQGRGFDSVLAKAVIHAADVGARVINISSTAPQYSAALSQAIQYAQGQGALIVAAAGNTGDGDNQTMYPAAFDGVVAVGAVDQENVAAPFSQRGSFVSLVAPGVDVPSTALPSVSADRYASYSGTSIAAPHVSGVAALMWSLRPDLAAGDISAALQASTDDLGPPGRDDRYGAGLVDAGKAIDAVRLGVAPRAPTDGQVAAAVAAPPPLPDGPRRWYFAEGSTKAPFQVFFAVQNPSARSLQVRFTFLSPDGVRHAHEMPVPANSRVRLAANSVMPEAEFATIVEADGPIFVERTMYFGHDGHSVTGAREPARLWYLAEGSTTPPFDTWILLANPGDAPASAGLQFMLEDGTNREQPVSIPAHGRTSVYVNLLFTASGFSTRVVADQPIVVERAMYFDQSAGGHDTLAIAAPARRWYMAAGATGPGSDTWLLVQNPGDAPASVQVTLFTDDGRTITQPLLVKPRARSTLFTNLVVPKAVFGMRVDSDQPVVVERAVYVADDRAGFDSAAVPSPDTEWYLPEGATNGSFEEQLAILNPQPSAANVEIQVTRQDGQPVPPTRIRVSPLARTTVDVNAIVPDADVSIRIISSQPIVAERTSYFAVPDGVGVTHATGLTR